MSRLQALGLACRRGRRLLFEGLSFGLGDGQALRVKGGNGAGKTSLLRQLVGLAPADAGEVHWDGRPIARQREAYGAALAYLGHAPGLKDELTPLENLAADAALAGGADTPAQHVQALADWGLAAAARLPLRVLSAGQRRRVALARLSLSGAALWILDEPFTALDDAGCAQLGQLIERHLARGGLAVLTSHQPLPLAEARVQVLELQG